MQAETHGAIVLPSGHLMQSWEHPAASWSLRGEIGVALGLFLALIAVMAVLLAASSAAPADGARPAIAPGTTHPVADPHGVRPSLLETTG